MDSTYAGCLSIDENYAGAPARQVLEDVMEYLRQTLEFPFVAVVIRDGNDEPQAVVTHGEEMGQYDLLQKTDSRHASAEWTATTGQPLQWVMEDLLGVVSYRSWAQLADMAVIREEVEEAACRRDGYEVVAETERVTFNRNRCFDGVSACPAWVAELQTEPVYETDAMRAAGERAHRERIGATVDE